VRWYCRSVDAPKVREAGAPRACVHLILIYPQPETVINLWHSFAAWATGSKPPWTLEAEEAAAEAEAEAATAADAAAPADDKTAERELDTHSVSSSLASAVQLRNAKRRLTAFGVLGVYLVWCVPARIQCRMLDAGWLTLAPTRRAIFAWFIFTCAPRGPLAFRATHINSHNDTRARRRHALL
jgi:hypothetical protein